jgi:hypothetical protein
MENLDKQIELNIKLETLIQNLKDSEFKLTKKLNAFNFKISDYKRKIKKADKLNNDSYAKRASIYINTCNEMISYYTNCINEAKEMFKSEYEYTRQELFQNLNSAIINNYIEPETLQENDKCIIYSIPSAKLVFQKQFIKVSDPKALKSFLVGNNLDYINPDDYSVDFESLKKELIICEEGTIIYEKDGLIVDGVSLTEHDLSIVY